MVVVNVMKEQYPCFNSVAIETASMCNRNCKFCPVSMSRRPDELMSDKLYRKIIDDLVSINYRGRISFYIYNEPLRDKRLPVIIRYASQALPKACLMVATNGDYVKKRYDIARLFDEGLNQLQVNIYSELRAKFLTSIMAEIKDWCGLEENGSIYTWISPKRRTFEVCHKYVLPWGKYQLQNRSGQIDYPTGTEHLQFPLEKMCVRPFRFLNINWRGQGLVCCNDYHAKQPIGDVSVSHIMDVWNSHIMNWYRIRLQNKVRAMLLCAKCDYNGGVYQGNIRRVTFGTELDKVYTRYRKLSSASELCDV